MDQEMIKEIATENGISDRKVEEMIKISLFFGYTYYEAKEGIKSFYLSK